MPGLTILHALPRLLGTVDQWSGLSDKNSESWLLDHAKSMGFNTIWLSPFFKTSNLNVVRDGKTVSGSLYATTDHFSLDDDFSSGSNQQDDRHLRHFTKKAKEKNLTIMGDLVFNHVARDHQAVLEEDAKIEGILKNGSNVRPLYRKGNIIGMSWADNNGQSQKIYFKFHRNTDFSLALTGANHEIWDDVARINYGSPAARSFFVTGEDNKPGYWKQVIDWHIDRGFTGFRCDVAYMVPPDVWSELIQHAHDRQPGVVFMAETLGDNGQANHLRNAHVNVNGQKRRGFDLAMLGTYWWNFRDNWLVQENERMKSIARFGGATFPDNHDTDNTVAGHFMDVFSKAADPVKRNRIVSDICLRNYAVAALMSNSVYMQLGYEYCRKPVSVFRDPSAPHYWQRLCQDRQDPSHPLNLTERIRAINKFRQKINEVDAAINVNSIQNAQTPHTLKMDCSLHHYKTGQVIGRMVIYINEKPEKGPVKIPKSALQDSDSDQNGTKRLKRLVLDDKDKQESHFYEVSDVAAFYTPIHDGPDSGFTNGPMQNGPDHPPRHAA